MKKLSVFLSAIAVLGVVAFGNAQNVGRVVNQVIAVTCSNQFVRSIAESGLGTCATVAIGSDVGGLGTGVATLLSGSSSGSGGPAGTTSATLSSPDIATIVSAGGNTQISNANGLLKLTTTAGGATNPNKYFQTGTTGTLTLWNSAFSLNLLTVTDAGAIGMPQLASTSAAQTGTLCWATGTGNVTVDTTTTCLLSSARFKHDIRPLDGSLATVLALKPVSYEYNELVQGEQIGLVAEDVEKVDDRLVSHEPDGTPRAVRYQQLTAHLIGAIQQQQREIDALKARLK